MLVHDDISVDLHVALIAVMAQVGSFVPAQSASIRCVQSPVGVGTLKSSHGTKSILAHYWHARTSWLPDKLMSTSQAFRSLAHKGWYI